MRGFMAIMMLSLVACAKIMPPDGGPKDTDPPEVVAMVPPALTTNFRSDRIYIEFNEYVRLNDIYNQLVVSPPLKKRPEISLKGKAVTIEFAEELERGVTYTLQFGEGIVDLNEGNPARELQYVFSTGEELDSLVVRGRAYDLVSGEPLDATKIMLYRNFADSMPLTSKPDYFGLSDPDGTFELDYLAEGTYRMFALKEENFNYLYDDFEELIGFRTDSIMPVQPSDSICFVEIALNREPDTLQYLQSYDVDSTGFIRAQLYKRPQETRASYSFDLLDTGRFEAQVVRVLDSLLAWHDDPINEQQLSWLFMTPTSQDTIEVEVLDFGPGALLNRNPPPANLAKEDTLNLTFNRPLAAIDTSLISFYRDSIKIAGNAEVVPGSFEARFVLELEDGGKYAIDILPGALQSREGYTSDTLRWSFGTWDTDYFGKVIVKVVRDVPVNGILQLLTKDQVIRQKAATQGEEIVFDRLLPATYTLRLLDDQNANGRWDPSHYMQSLQAEPLKHFGNAVQVRSNWEMELEW